MQGCLWEEVTETFVRDGLGWVEIALPHKAWLNTSSTPLQCDHLSLYAFSDLKSKLYPIILVSSKQRTLDWTSGCRLVCSETGEIKFRTEPYQKQDTCWNKLHEQNLPSCFFPHYVFCWCLRKLSLTKIICIALARRFLCLKSSSLFFIFSLKSSFFPPSPLPIKNKVKRMHAWVKQGLNCWLCFRNTSSSPHFSILRTGLIFHVKSKTLTPHFFLHYSRLSYEIPKLKRQPYSSSSSCAMTRNIFPWPGYLFHFCNILKNQTLIMPLSL